MLHVTLVAPRILKWLPEFGKSVHCCIEDGKILGKFLKIILK
jgi:hypothetical protein